MNNYLKRLLAILLVAVLFTAVGCAVKTLRETQDHFNKGAQIELRALDASLLNDNPDAGPGDAFSALNEYRLAYSKAKKLIETESKSLKQDNLLGAAYVLKALAIWRISDLEGDELQKAEKPGATIPEQGLTNSRQQLLSVLNEIDQGMEKQAFILGTRDRVLYKALYGFYDHDGGRAADDYETAKVWFKSAFDRLGESIDSSVPLNHPVRVYIGSARLRTLAAWNKSIYIEQQKCLARDAACKKKFIDEKKVIKAYTKETVCGINQFWHENDALKTSLKKLLAPIGLLSLLNDRTCEPPEQ